MIWNGPICVAGDFAGGIELSVRRAEAALNGGEQEWLRSLRQKWPDHFDSFYSDHLYFSFSEN